MWAEESRQRAQIASTSRARLARVQKVRARNGHRTAVILSTLTATTNLERDKDQHFEGYADQVEGGSDQFGHISAYF